MDSQRRRLVLAALASVSASRFAGAQDAAPALPIEEVPYVQTPPRVVRRMLQMAEIKSSDVLWDLGSGDGRIVIAAATEFGARAVGYEIDPALIRESRARAQRAGVASRTKFLEKDLFSLAFAEPSVVTLYLLPEFNMKLRPMLLAQMRPGTRVVSHEWDMGDWQPDETLVVRSPEKPYGTNREHKMMLWVIPAPVAGRWRIETAMPHPANGLTIELTQRIQILDPTPDRGETPWAHLRGTSLAIGWNEVSTRWALRGQIAGGQWRGELQRVGQWANSSINRLSVPFVAKRA